MENNFIVYVGTSLTEDDIKKFLQKQVDDINNYANKYNVIVRTIKVHII